VNLNIESVLDELTASYRERGCDAAIATMTVVVFFENSAIGELARDRIRMLADKHPSRIIVLDGAQTGSLHRIESCDWIELGVKDSGPEALRSAISRLKLPEAPVVLLWIARGFADDPRFAALCEDVQTIVYNSSLLDTGHEALGELVAYVDSHSDSSIADIAYLRLKPWQECVAIFFDGKAAEELRELQGVEIACGSEPEGFYLLGWLASRLDWKPSEPGALVDRSGKRVVFEVLREGEPRRMSRIALRSARSTFVAEIDKGQESILLRVTGSSEHTPRYRAVSNPGIAALVERAILWGHNDAIFHAALAAAGDILALRKD
jgi:hypothetical protein